MREAFGVQPDSRYAGVLENDGIPISGKLKNAAQVSTDQASNTPSPDEGEDSDSAKTKAEREFALASASLRQALQDMPELTEISKNVIFEETKDGLNMEITDQDGRSMFAEGSKVPYDRTRLLIQRLAAPLRATPLRIAIAGHTSAGLQGTDRLQRVRPVVGPRQCRAPDSGARGRADQPDLCRLRPGRQPAAVSRTMRPCRRIAASRSR